MDETTIPHRLLAEARDCHLIEADGRRREVLDVSFEDGRAWVRIRNRAEDAPSGTPEVLETVLGEGATLEWELPEEARIRAVSGGGGLLRWEREGLRGRPPGNGRGRGSGRGGHRRPASR